jgi:hypothetical protein
MDEESSTCSRHDCSARPEHPRHRNCVRPPIPCRLTPTPCLLIGDTRNQCLPRGKVRHWRDVSRTGHVKPAIEIYLDRADVVSLAPADMVRNAPDLWSSEKAAKRAMEEFDPAAVIFGAVEGRFWRQSQRKPSRFVAKDAEADVITGLAQQLGERPIAIDFS